MIVRNCAERTVTGVTVAGFAGIAPLSLVAGSVAASGTDTAGTTAGTGMTGGGGIGGVGMMGGAGMGGMGAFAPLALLALVGLLALGYVGIRAIATATEDASADGEVDDDEEADPIARLQRRYTEGELTEAEFERALERELADEPPDDDVGVDAASADPEPSARNG
ncbi:SHOCT domain-containing protein [Halorubrum yunnanense]|uniref:SHOCT domain-containing protein n=1 Tax=Halorubrum yunnanense TaxID=1526162 RepID=A0ABD5YD68_9EURY|nr:SHOCT domain-containing protein [Halorubrum yunnanense]